MDNAIKFSQAGSVLMVGVKEEFLPLTVTRSKFLCVTDNSAANSLTMSILEIALLYSTKSIIQNNAVTGKHNRNCLMPIVLFAFQMRLMKIRIFNRMQSP